MLDTFDGGGFVATGLPARWDGASAPAALLRAGAAFGATLTAATALLALAAGVLT
ncbi:hypothetical protein [Streptomyces sp. CMB-StM0423]|uniref:hypothetical protein n=1 Tax=Streptomyces sp. CMB-StM0423 TaxID=2059884 RepID=UPI0018FE086E|nr:hypothetical protein [Streptomyces sp. CMB-StM0423]